MIVSSDKKEVNKYVSRPKKILIENIESVLEDTSLNSDDKIVSLKKIIQQQNQINNNFDNYSFKLYTNINFISRGGFGTVFSAKHILDNNDYAIKIIPLKNISNHNDVLKKIREIRCLSKLNHPNIIRYYTSWLETSNIPIALDDDSDSSKTSTEYSSNRDSSLIIYNDDQENDDLSFCMNSTHLYLFLKMELMEMSLKEFIHDRNKLDTFSQSINYTIMTGIIDGLHHLHSQTPPIIHYDIKPDNILLNFKSNQIEIKIADFGLVKIFNENSKINSNLGTYTYKAPELDIVDTKVNMSADIYSLGILFYELHLNFKTEMEKFELIKKFKEGILKTNTLLDKMIDNDPNKRPNIFTIKNTFSSSYCFKLNSNSNK